MGLGSLSACSTAVPTPTPLPLDTVSGVVMDEDGPVAGASVRVQTTAYFATTTADGHFTLSVAELGDGPFELTAWAPGYFCVGPVEATAGQTDVELHLHAHAAEDNRGYAWLPSQYHPGQGEDRGCAACHSSEGRELSFT